MKYLLMIYGNTENWGHPAFLRAAEAQSRSQEERDRLGRQFETPMTEIAESGEPTGDRESGPVTNLPGQEQGESS
ncbi:hypothetical protein [Nonomuraea sp. NPDC050643]|uniref:hypothetical protein n=1 Tax=Nonomuraea sp. NPDC050643 TaxID=3155660 RepID=UPI0033C9CF54